MNEREAVPSEQPEAVMLGAVSIGAHRAGCNEEACSMSTPSLKQPQPTAGSHASGELAQQRIVKVRAEVILPARQRGIAV